MESISLYHDMQTNAYYLLNNTTGVRTRVSSNTEYQKEFDAQLTGQVGYKERVKYAHEKQNPGYLPLKATSIRPPRSTLFYTPQTDKLEGYCQFPQPLTKPYFNQQGVLSHNPQRRKEIHVQEKSFKPDSQVNHRLYSFDPTTKHNVGVSHLTNSIKDQAEQDVQQTVKVLGERQITRYSDMSQSQTTFPSPRKIINGRSIVGPTQTVMDKHQLNRQLGSTTLHVKTHTIQQIDQGLYVEPLEKDKQILIETFSMERDQRDCDFKHFSQASQFYQASTFDGKSFSSPMRLKPQSMKSDEDFNRELQYQKQQLESFQIPQSEEKHLVSTKGRYNVNLPTIREQDQKDTKIMMLLYPELYVETFDPRKQKQEELRRKINRMKETEMLERNLRNKV